MNLHKLCSNLLIIVILLPILLVGSPEPTRAVELLNTPSARQSFVDEPTDGLIRRPHPGLDVGEPSRELEGETHNDFSPSVIQSSPGSHTWDSDADFADGAYDFTEAVSGTGQITLLRHWSVNIKANDDTGTASQENPSLAVDADGNIYVAWEDERNGDYDIYFAKSIDGGVTWSTNVKVNDDTSSSDQEDPSLAVDGNGDLYLAWDDERGGGSDIYFAKSTDGGVTWNTNVKVNSQGSPSLVVDNSGGLYIACAGAGIYFTKSIDGGDTWSTNVKVNDNSASAYMSAPSLAIGNSDTIYLAWQDERNENRDIYFAKSIDGGDVWSTNVKVNDDLTSANQREPSLAVGDSGTLYLAWGDDRNTDWDSANNIYFASSPDNGATWSANIQVTDDSNQYGAPSLVANDDDILYIAWHEYYCPMTCVYDGIYLARSINRGTIWSVDMQARDVASWSGAGKPSLAADSEGNLYLAWDDQRNGSYNDDIYTAHWPDNAHVHTEGSYTADYDAGDLVAWNSLAWTATLPSGTDVTLAARVGNTPTVDLHWSDWVTFTTSPADLSALPPARYIQWRARFSSPISTTTPALDAVTVDWDGFDYTRVGGTMSIDATWTAADSPYLASGNVVVDQDVTLTLEPGTEVWFEDQRALNVMGTLVALGSASQPITFTSWHAQKHPGDWGAVAFAHTAGEASFDADGHYLGGSALSNVTVEYAGAGDFDYAVDAASTALYVNCCSLRHNDAGALQVGGDGSRVMNSVIVSNTAQEKGGGIYNVGTDTDIRSNTIISNTAANGGGIANEAESATIGGNIIGDNHATNEGGGIFNVQPSAAIYDNVIRENVADVEGGGIAWEGSAGDILYNSIFTNTTAGSTGGIYVQDGDNYPLVHYNAFQGNAGYVLYNDNQINLFDPTHLNARYNWWGTADEVTILDLIYDGLDNPDKSLVDYNPYMLEERDLSPKGVDIDGRSTGVVGIAYHFDASVTPIAAIPPLTYTWQAAGKMPITHVSDDLHDTASFTWTTPGSYVITVTVQNSKGSANTFHPITITEVSSRDRYETNDTCAQANAITTTGDAQIHTFHTVDDVDWVSFPATDGTTYVIEAVTPDDSEADVILELYNACGGDLQGEQDNVFSPNVRLSFTASQDGPLYLHLADHRDTAGNQAATYHLSVHTLPPTPPTSALVLVGGKNKNNDALQSNIYHVTNAVYRAFRDNGYTAEDIYYLAPDTELDGDGDGAPDVDAESTKNNLQSAITTWAAGKVHDADDTLTIYMMDHGNYDAFYLNYLDYQAKTVSAYELDGWLDTLEAAAPGVQINVVIESCHSGSFIDPAQSVSQPGRVVIASTGAHQLAYASQQGATFSDAFVTAMRQGMNLNGSFEEAQWAVGQAHPLQAPWLDDNGDGVANGDEDGNVAAQRGFAVSFDNVGWPPYIAQVAVDQKAGEIEAEVQIEGSQVISQVWALLYPPSYEPPESGEDLGQEDVPRVALTDPEGDGLYTATTTAFTEAGTYRVVVYALDTTGLSARPKQAFGVGGGLDLGHKVYLPLVMRE